MDQYLSRIHRNFNQHCSVSCKKSKVLRWIYQTRNIRFMRQNLTTSYPEYFQQTVYGRCYKKNQLLTETTSLKKRFASIYRSSTSKHLWRKFKPFPKLCRFVAKVLLDFFPYIFNLLDTFYLPTIYFIFKKYPFFSLQLFQFL